MFIVKREDNPLLCLFNHLLFMALHNDIFVAKSVRNVSHIFGVKVPSGKKCLQLKMKHNILNILIFHEPERAVSEYHTLSTQSL